jgi:hypothetical protein
MKTHAAEHPPDAVLGDEQAAPLLPGPRGADPPRPVAGVPEREGDDPLLQMRSDLVGHPGSAELAHVERLQAPPIDALLQPVLADLPGDLVNG